MAPSKGRPPIDNPKSGRLNLRVTPLEKAEIMEFAQKHGYTLLELIRKGMEAVEKEGNPG